LDAIADRALAKLLGAQQVVGVCWCQGGRFNRKPDSISPELDCMNQHRFGVRLQHWSYFILFLGCGYLSMINDLGQWGAFKLKPITALITLWI